MIKSTFSQTHQLAVLPSNKLASFLLRPALFTSTSTPASGLQQHTTRNDQLMDQPSLPFALSLQ
jgi:hypothetical protein